MHLAALLTAIFVAGAVASPASSTGSASASSSSPVAPYPQPPNQDAYKVIVGLAANTKTNECFAVFKGVCHDKNAHQNPKVGNYDPESRRCKQSPQFAKEYPFEAGNFCGNQTAYLFYKDDKYNGMPIKAGEMILPDSNLGSKGSSIPLVITDKPSCWAGQIKDSGDWYESC